MPYLTPADRAAVDAGKFPTTAGELNYAITQLCRMYLQGRGVKYANINEVVGALECAKLEFYRRAAAPYEDKKIAENGDVYV